MGMSTSSSGVSWRAPRRKRETQFDEKREAVLRAAALLFRERGYEAASLNDLADRLKITKPTVYYYVQSKDKLLLEIKKKAQKEILDFMKDVVGRGDTGYETLRAIMIKWAHIMISDYGACLTLIPARALEKASRAEIEDGIEEAAQIFYKVFAQGKADGTLDFPHPVVASNALFGSLNWIAAWFDPKGKISAEKLAVMQVDMLLDGVRGPKAPKKAKAAGRK
jgi:AcrR family transcriptional regulator